MTCGRKIGPFDCCSVVCGDCLELMKQLPDGCVDAVITDPPYGMGKQANCFRENDWGKLAPTRNYGNFDWDIKPDQECFDSIRRVSTTQVIFGGNYFADMLPASRCWFVWDKEVPAGNRYADCELAWTNIDGAVRKIAWLWNGMIRKGDDIRVHPTQKPEGVMLWCIQRISNADTILDPYAGSGTTLYAAAKLGRHFLGFEISPEYCAIARQRIALVEAQPNLFEPKAEQLTLGGTE